MVRVMVSVILSLIRTPTYHKASMRCYALLALVALLTLSWSQVCEVAPIVTALVVLVLMLMLVLDLVLVLVY